MENIGLINLEDDVIIKFKYDNLIKETNDSNKLYGYILNIRDTIENCEIIKSEDINQLNNVEIIGDYYKVDLGYGEPYYQLIEK